MIRSGRSRVVVLIPLMLILFAGVAPAKRMPFGQLPREWSRLFPAPHEIRDSGFFPIIKPPEGDGELPFTLPGTPQVTLRGDAFYDDSGAGTPIEAASLDYELEEKSTWAADGREFALWEADFDVAIGLSSSEAETAQDFAQYYDPARDTPVPLGDQAYFSHVAGRDQEHLYVRKGRYSIAVGFDISPGMYRGAVHETLRQLAQHWAGLIVRRIAGGPPQTGGTRIAVTARMGGNPPQTQYVDVPAGKTPGQITIRVTTRQMGQGGPQPVGGVTVSLPDYNATATTSPAGAAVLRAQGGGQDAIIGAVTFDMQAQAAPAGIELLIRGPDLLPVMGGGELQVTVRDAQSHVPLTDATVKLTLLDAAKLPFVELQQPPHGPMPAATAFTRRITVNEPTQAMVDGGRLKLHDMPLGVRLKVEAWLNSDATVRAEQEWSAPMDLLMLRGTTVGPDMQPRSEAKPPRLVGGGGTRPHLASQLDPTIPGRFHVLTRASFYSDQTTLSWPPGCRLLLQVPMTRFAQRLAGQRMEAGRTADLGKIDVLEPAEHEQRIKTWVAEFLDAMQYDNGHLASTKSALAALPVAYPGGNAGASPVYGNGQITVYQAEHEYWGQQAFTSQDPPYAIFFHELGHMVHRTMVDRWLTELGWCDKFRIGGDHSTWRTPDASTEGGKAMTSFFEAIADFHAYCVFAHLDRVHPEFRQDSIYHDRGYLTEFDTDSRALMTRSLGGWQVEGVQTTLLREVYGQTFTAGPGGPATSFGQVLRLTDAWTDESWIMRWVPARTIRQWTAMKRKHAPAPGLEQAVQKYGIDEGRTARVIIPCGPTVRPTRVSVNGTEHALKGDSFAVDILDGQTIEIVEGQTLILIEAIGRPASYRRVFADQGTRLRFDSESRLTIEAGRVIVDGQITIAQGTTTVTPSGTVVMVEVGQGGALAVTCIEGSAQVSAAGGSATLTSAQAVAVSPDGRLGTPRIVAVAQVMDAVLGPEAGGQVATGGGTPWQPGGGGMTVGGQAFQPMPLAPDSAIKQAVVCLGFDERSRLVGRQETYPAGTEKVALYLEMVDARPNSEIQVTWYLEDRIIGRHVLIVSGDKKNLSYLYAAGRDSLWVGSYAAEIRENGRLVGRLTFRIEGG